MTFHNIQIVVYFTSLFPELRLNEIILPNYRVRPAFGKKLNPEHYYCIFCS